MASDFNSEVVLNFFGLRLFDPIWQKKLEDVQLNEGSISLPIFSTCSLLLRLQHTLSYSVNHSINLLSIK